MLWVTVNVDTELDGCHFCGGELIVDDVVVAESCNRQVELFCNSECVERYYNSDQEEDHEPTRQDR